LTRIACQPLAPSGKGSARSAGAKVHVAWSNAVDTAAAVAVALPASFTVAEITDRLVTVVPAAAGAVRTMAWHVDKVVYAEVAPTPGDVAAAARAGMAVQGALRARLSLGRRIARRFDVRQLLQRQGRPARRRIGPTRAGSRE
jgi:hypothetical protein